MKRSRVRFGRRKTWDTCLACRPITIQRDCWKTGKRRGMTQIILSWPLRFEYSFFQYLYFQYLHSVDNIWTKEVNLILQPCLKSNENYSGDFYEHVWKNFAAHLGRQMYVRFVSTKIGYNTMHWVNSLIVFAF